MKGAPMLQSMTWYATDNLARNQFQMFSQLGEEMRLSKEDQRRVLLLYAGDLDSAASLLRHLRRYSREALLDGIPYRQFWGESDAPKQLPPPRYPLLRPEDEDEVERMFQRLKSVGRLDPRGSDEK